MCVWFIIVFSNVEIVISESVQEDAVRSLFLPRITSGEEEVRTSRMEYSIRVQRDRLEDQCTTVVHVPQPI